MNENINTETKYGFAIDASLTSADWHEIKDSCTLVEKTPELEAAMDGGMDNKEDKREVNNLLVLICLFVLFVTVVVSAMEFGTLMEMVPTCACALIFCGIIVSMVKLVKHRSNNTYCKTNPMYEGTITEARWLNELNDDRMRFVGMINDHYVCIPRFLADDVESAVGIRVYMTNVMDESHDDAHPVIMVLAENDFDEES